MITDELADYAIVGGGCAGLSLAVQLAERLPPTTRIVVIEPRTSYVRDRTWCYWRVRPHRFETAVNHTWHRWKVRYASREIIRESHRYTYQHIPGDAFYRTALERLAAAPNVTLKLGVTAQVITAAGEGAIVETDHGRLRAGHVFDSRPPATRGGLLQHFVGWRVRTATPCFSPRL
ncbi:MAG: lycopene cyclase family protein [Candidatus Competibacteraceae bacterium]